MSKTETPSRSTGALPDDGGPAAELKTALAGFMSDITERLHKQ